MKPSNQSDRWARNNSQDGPLRALKAVQITFHCDGQTDAEDRIRAILAAEGIELFGFSQCGSDEEKSARLVLRDGSEGRYAVETAGFRCEQTTSVVLVPLAGLGQKLEVMARLAGAGISVQHFYMLTNPDGSSHLVLKTRDDDRAISAIASQPAGSRAIERMFFTTPPAPTGAGDGLRTTEERLRSGTALAANLQPLRKENNHEPVEMGSVRVAALGPVQGN